jgi:hypothetical protein
MFYTQESVESKLICNKCERRYDIPKLLPCYQTICSNCEKLLIKNKQLKCPHCSSIHTLAEGQNEFPINDFVKNMLELKPIRLGRDEIREKLVDLLNKINSRVNRLRENDDGNSKLRTYCDILQNQIDIETESRIVKLNDERDSLMKFIENYQADCNIFDDDFKIEVENFINYCENSMKNFQSRLDLSQNELEEDYKKSKLLEARLAAFEYKLKHRIFNGQQLYIEEDNSEKSESENILPIKIRKKTLVMNIDLEKFDKSKFSVTGHNFDHDINLIVRYVTILPISESSILIATECYKQSTSNTYTTFLSTHEIMKPDFVLGPAKHSLTKNFEIESYDSTKDDIALVYSQLNTLDLYDDELELKQSLDLDFKPKCVKFSDENLIYVLSRADRMVTDELFLNFYIYVFDLSLKKVKIIGPMNDVKNLFSLISVHQSKLILSENEGENILIYCEKRNKLVKSIPTDTNQKIFYIDPICRLYLMHRRSKRFTVLNLNIDETNFDDHVILYDDILPIEKNYIDYFIVTNSGHLIIKDVQSENNFKLFIFI